MKELRMCVRREEEERNRVYKKFGKKDYKNMKVMRGVEDIWLTNI
jgi:hypothetical protein